MLLWLAIALLVLVGCDQPAPSGPPDIIVVCMDTLRADRLGVYGNADGLTPNIDRFASEGVVFEDAWAVANATLFSRASPSTSLYATETGPIYETLRLSEEPPTLAGVLGLYGYQSAGFTGGGHLSEDFGLGRGFDLFERSDDWGSLFHSVPDAVRWLDGRDPERPSLLFVHGYDTHHRYLKPGPWGFSRVDASYRGTGADVVRDSLGSILAVDGYYFGHHAPADLLNYRALRIRGRAERRRIARLSTKRSANARKLEEQDLAFVRGVYDGSVSYADTWFGVFLAALERRGLLETSVVVLLSDHGEELGEDGLFHHRYTLSDLNLKVPLVVRLPGGAHGGRRVPGLVDLTDVMPTLLEAAGAEAPAGIRGHSLWPTLQGGPPMPRAAVYAQTAFRGVSIRTDQGRLGFTGIGADSPFLAPMLAATRLEGQAFEASAELDDDQRRVMRHDLAAWAAQLRQHDAPDQITISPEQLEVIQQKGYWGAK